MAQFGNLTRNQRRALAALLASPSVLAACRTSGLGQRTFYRYLADPQFKQALTQAEAGLIDETGRRLLAGGEQALDTLEGILSGPGKDSDRRQAASAWLDYLLRFRELRDIEDRLAALEAAVYGEGNITT